MSHSDHISLTQEELRRRLYQTFKNKGVLDSLKTQLRNQLIQDLKHAHKKEPLQSSDMPRDTLVHQACNSLVANYLTRCGYEYSLSVFYPECGLEKDKVLNIHDLMQLMKINPDSRLYKSLMSSVQNSDAKGFLIQILTELIDHHLNQDGKDVDTQTVASSPYKESIVDKLKFIDEKFDELYPKRSKSESLEGKLAAYRREIEEQLQQEMSQKLKHFKDVEIAKIKLEEREKSQKEISDLRRELEKTYQSKLEGLVQREKNAVERLQKQQEIESKEVYAQRQILLNEIEVVRSREIELRQRMEGFELTQKLQEDKNKTMDDFLRKRELEVKNIEDTFEQKLKNELLRYQIELKEEYLTKSHKVNDDDRKNREEAARLREDTIIINMKKQELEQALSRTKHLEMEVDTLRAQMSAVTHQNHHLTDKLKEFADYPLVQEEKVELEAQVKLLKKQLDELQKENHVLRERISQPSGEFLSLQDDLKRMEAARKFDQDEFKIQREILEKQLELEMERGLEMKMQLLNREEALKRLNIQVEQLDFQLRQTQQALESVPSIPKAPHRSVLHFPANQTVRPDASINTLPLRSRFMDSIVETGGIADLKHRHLEGTRSSSPDSDLEFVANTKARIKELEKEAEMVEDAFRNYQNRVIHAASTPSYPHTATATNRGYFTSVPSAPQPRVTFLEDNLTPQEHVLLNRIKNHRFESLLPTEAVMASSRSKKSSARRLSSTPLSRSETSSKHRVSAEGDGSYISSSQHSPNHRLSPISNIDQTSSNRLSPIRRIEHPQALYSDVTDGGVEVENETTLRQPVERLAEGSIIREARRKVDEAYPKDHDELEWSQRVPSADQTAANRSESTTHSKPAKLHYEDLNNSDSSLQSKSGDNTEHSSDRKMVLESRLSDSQEDSEEERRESPEFLEKADSQQEVSLAETKASKEKQEENISVNSPEQEYTTVHGAEGTSMVNAPDNPLDKYMHLLLENRAEQQPDKAAKESAEEVSVAEKLSNESITAQSMGEADEDFCRELNKHGLDKSQRNVPLVRYKCKAYHAAASLLTFMFHIWERTTAVLQVQDS
ncbi:centriole and centriolar satellite protein OFD1 isoform X3 [Hyperolius riggenbachi]|uniref:centriole and centriolar satellite protein OFD1 isoform X3 n=1 Tax=Hyperolius riggenbachi TaxID=752182 RepID=UPI0035A2BE09